MERSEDFKTPLGRFAFTRGLFEAQEQKSGKKQWTVTMLFQKGSDLSALEKAVVEAATKEWGDKAVQWMRDGLIKIPVLDGDGKQGLNKKTGERHQGYAGHKFIRLQSGEAYRPKIVNQKVLPITDQNELYSGCYGYAVINAFTWENSEQGKGVSFSMSLVQKAKDGERLGGGGGVDVEKWAEVIPEDETAVPDAAKSGAGAAGLFD